MADGSLKRQVGVAGAVVLGLGSILGTGVFVSLGLAAGAAGPAVVLAIVIAGCLATCNGLSSAQLAAAHPVAGGTYAYGCRYLNPTLGFLAGFMFLTAKSASAATAALGFAGYVLAWAAPEHVERWSMPVALVAVVALTGLVLTGLRRSNVVNGLIVTVTVAALVTFIVAALPRLEMSNFGFTGAGGAGGGRGAAGGVHLPGVLEAAALAFVAYTGYGRVATLGEEIHDPGRNIPRAVITTLIVTAVLYVAVAVAAVGLSGAERFAAAATGEAAPLEVLARETLGRPVAIVVTIGAITAMLGVLLNLILGLSRVALAMGRQRDIPAVFGRVNAAGTTPGPAVLGVATIIVVLAALGSVKTAWSLSAVTVLIYYGLTNLAALQLTGADRRYPKVISWAGLAGCLGLAVFVDWPYLLVAAVLVGVALAWHTLAGLFRGGGGPGH